METTLKPEDFEGIPNKTMLAFYESNIISQVTCKALGGNTALLEGAGEVLKTEILKRMKE